jgi:DNA-binding transcriptional ArsR family regulator
LVSADRWSESVLDLVTSRLALIADRTRAQILVALEQREANVQELADQLPSTPQNISRHLGILYRSGLVARRREGTSVRYSLADYSACRILDEVLVSLAGQLEEQVDIVQAARTT